MERDGRDFVWRASILFPIGVTWKAREYNISNDEMRRGWYVYVCRLSVGKFAYSIRIGHEFRISVQAVDWFTAVLAP